MSLVMKHTRSKAVLNTGTLIFFHGSRDTGVNHIEWVHYLLGKPLQFPNVKIIYPTAPQLPHTPHEGHPSNIWFDRIPRSIETPENRTFMKQMYGIVNDLICKETQEGILPHRIIVGGFSAGGTLALHAGFHLNQQLGGIFTCSSFLKRDSIVYDTMQSRCGNQPELRMYHGTKDPKVPLKWGEETFEKLTKFGVKGKFTPLPDTQHEMNRQMLQDIESWILKKVQ